MRVPKSTPEDVAKTICDGLKDEIPSYSTLGVIEDAIVVTLREVWPTRKPRMAKKDAPK